MGRSVNRTIRTFPPRRLAAAALVPLLALALVSAALAIRTVHRPPPFSLKVTPRQTRVVPGQRVIYMVTMRPAKRFTGRVRLRVLGAPRGARRRFSRVALRLGPRGCPRSARRATQRRACRAALTITTTGSTRVGRYTLRIQASRGRMRRTFRVTLIVVRSAGISVHGDVEQALFPGMAQPVDLLLTNPNGRAVSITNIAVALRTVGLAAERPAPGTCSAADFAVAQFSGPYPIRLAAHQTASMSRLGFAPAEMPQVEMIDQPYNQDGCAGARIGLSFTSLAR